MSLHHPFGELLTGLRLRKPGLSQTRLAELIGYAPAILVRMCQGKKDLTGPSGRERIIRILNTLCDEGVRLTLAEANALLISASLPPLFEGLPVESALIHRLQSQVPQITHRTNVAPALTSFIGREADVAELAALITRERLMTLVGAGGVGKTRLALEVAAHIAEPARAPHSMRHPFQDGVWAVMLGVISDPHRIALVVAEALGLPASREDAALATLQRHLAEKHTLLVLDNCEHVIDACVEFIQAILPRCPHVHVLATSREALRIPGEMVWQVSPLSIPETAQESPAQVLGSEAAQLFVARAQESQRKFALSDENVADVARICQRLDGIPLALELAAAQVEAMTVQEIVARLDNHLTLLTAGYRNAMPRHHTMRSALDWSYHLLSPAQQRILATLSVFAGGWTLEMAEVVCDAMPDALLQLVRKSLVLAEPHGGTTRYRMLEPIRQYAAEKLAERGDENIVRDRHLACYVDFAARADAGLMGDEVSVWEQRVRADYENFRAARTWCRATHDCEAELRLAGALWRYWVLRAELREGMAWINEAFDNCPAAAESSQARALYGMATMARYLRDYRRMTALAEQGMVLCQMLGDRHGVAICQLLLAVAAHVDFDEAREAALREESQRILLEVKDYASLINLSVDEAWSAIDQGKDALASASLRQHLDLGRKVSDFNSVWTALWWLAFVAYRRNDPPQAVDFLEQSLVVARELGVSTFTARSIELWGWVDRAQGMALGNEELRLRRDAGDDLAIAHLLLALGRMYVDSGDLALAQPLLAECVSRWESLAPAGDEWSGAGWACIELGHIARLNGDSVAALEKYAESRRRHVEAGAVDGVATAELHSGHAAVNQNLATDAKMHFKSSLAHFQEAGLRPGIAFALAGLADVAVLEGDIQRATQIAGAASAHVLAKELATMREVERCDFERCIQAAQFRLSAVACAQARDEGQALSLKQAISCGLAL